MGHGSESLDFAGEGYPYRRVFEQAYANLRRVAERLADLSRQSSGERAFHASRAPPDATQKSPTGFRAEGLQKHRENRISTYAVAEVRRPEIRQPTRARHVPFPPSRTDHRRLSQPYAGFATPRPGRPNGGLVRNAG